MGVVNFMSKRIFNDEDKKDQETDFYSPDNKKRKIFNPLDTETHKILQKFLNFKKIINLDDKSMPNLHIASKYGMVDAVKQLVEKNEDIIEPIEFGYTPLYLAIQYGHLEVVQYFLEQNKNIVTNYLYKNKFGALSLSAKYNHIQITKCLLEQVIFNDKEKDNAIYAAVKHGNNDMLQFLFNNGFALPNINEVKFSVFTSIKDRESVIEFIKTYQLQDLEDLTLFGENYYLDNYDF
jgi:ankyrin repeat protein